MLAGLVPLAAPFGARLKPLPVPPLGNPLGPPLLWLSACWLCLTASERASRIERRAPPPPLVRSRAAAAATAMACFSVRWPEDAGASVQREGSFGTRPLRQAPGPGAGRAICTETRQHGAQHSVQPLGNEDREYRQQHSGRTDTGERGYYWYGRQRGP